jgi:5-methylcytosine-specific restriction protein A
MIDPIRLTNALKVRFGLEVQATIEAKRDGQTIIVHPTGIAKTISFRVEIHLGWRSISAVFLPGNYASELVMRMKKASYSQKEAFSIFSDSLKLKGAKVCVQLDSKSYDSSNPHGWPDDWNNITIDMKKVGVVVEKATGYDFHSVFDWTTSFFGLAISLLPLVADNEHEYYGEKEGDLKVSLVRSYERSRINRAACIQFHGVTCQICEFDFRTAYGCIGDGFIHVHHIVPLSQVGESYQLNPRKDLIPVCPNCHSMLHRRKPAFEPSELLAIMNRTSPH